MPLYSYTSSSGGCFNLGDAEKGLSTLGNVEWFEGAAIGWHSNRSKRVALSTGESEVMALVKAGKTNIYLKDVLRDMPSSALIGIVGWYHPT